ncbi:hypothetical protein NQ318_006974 [Aromia moschata]|uniref:Uncharacterized protein n=1 Tax=Aromia moschata TaxID=1265417 RepID=A0AAV8Y6S7_9CUCU|nr:hypothetical protein NQ318_006974 [Aromia moschata]
MYGVQYLEKYFFINRFVKSNTKCNKIFCTTIQNICLYFCCMKRNIDLPGSGRFNYSNIEGNKNKYLTFPLSFTLNNIAKIFFCIRKLYHKFRRNRTFFYGKKNNFSKT